MIKLLLSLFCCLAGAIAFGAPDVPVPISKPLLMRSYYAGGLEIPRHISVCTIFNNKVVESDEIGAVVTETVKPITLRGDIGRLLLTAKNGSFPVPAVEPAILRRADYGLVNEAVYATNHRLQIETFLKHEGSKTQVNDSEATATLLHLMDTLCPPLRPLNNL